MTTHKIIAALMALAMVSACTQPNGAPNAGIMNGGGVNKQDAGTVLGAVGGGFLGNQIGGGSGRAVATVGGVLLGGLLGNQVGKSLDNADLAAYNQASQRAMENGQPGQALPWHSQNASGTVTPSNYYQSSNGQYCREYTQTITVGGSTKQGYGTACRQSDGTWKIVE
jgi:surface antigen